MVLAVKNFSELVRVGENTPEHHMLPLRVTS
jgi:hypothetical protein